MKELKQENNDFQKISKEEDRKYAMNFLNMHRTNNGNVLDPLFFKMDITKFCNNCNDSNQLFLISSHFGWIYFYTDELGLIEMEEKNGDLYIPDYIPVEPNEFNIALKKLNEYAKILNIVASNPLNENNKFEPITVENYTIQYLSVSQKPDNWMTTSLKITTTNEDGESKTYKVYEYFKFSGDDIVYEYKTISDNSKTIN